MALQSHDREAEYAVAAETVIQTREKGPELYTGEKSVSEVLFADVFEEIKSWNIQFVTGSPD